MPTNNTKLLHRQFHSNIAALLTYQALGYIPSCENKFPYIEISLRNFTNIFNKAKHTFRHTTLLHFLRSLSKRDTMNDGGCMC